MRLADVLMPAAQPMTNIVEIRLGTLVTSTSASVMSGDATSTRPTAKGSDSRMAPAMMFSCEACQHASHPVRTT